MYAVVETGGKQFKVGVGEVFDVELIEGQPGKQVVLDKILLAHDGQKLAIGRPYLESGSVTCDIVGQIKGPKTVSYKYRHRKSSKTKKGHRQCLSRLMVKSINV